MYACERFVSLKQVCDDFRISSDFAYTAFYEQLELKRRKDNQYPWPKAIGLDEHGFGRNFERRGGRAFVTMVVNQSRGKLMEVVFGKATDDLRARLAHIPGRENVEYASIDMYDGYRKYIRETFPNAKIVADKFHVLRLMSPSILKERRLIVGTNADRRARGLLLSSCQKMEWEDRWALRNYLKRYPRLHELWSWKERLHEFYRIRGYGRAAHAFEPMVAAMKASPEHEVRRLGKTLTYWREEVLNYFRTRMTNARLEGFNNVAAVVRRRAYGYRNPNNYRLRLLSAMS
jgi:transposase